MGARLPADRRFREPWTLRASLADLRIPTSDFRTLLQSDRAAAVAGADHGSPSGPAGRGFEDVFQRAGFDASQLQNQLFANDRRAAQPGPPQDLKAGRLLGVEAVCFAEPDRRFEISGVRTEWPRRRFCSGICEDSWRCGFGNGTLTSSATWRRGWFRWGKFHEPFIRERPVRVRGSPPGRAGRWLAGAKPSECRDA